MQEIAEGSTWNAFDNKSITGTMGTYNIDTYDGLVNLFIDGYLQGYVGYNGYPVSATDEIVADRSYSVLS